MTVSPDPTPDHFSPLGDDLPRAQRRRLTQTLFRQCAATESADERAHLIDQIITVNMGVARSVARRYRGRGIPLDDLVQVANAALVRVAHAYDPERDRDFLAYAVPSIRGELRKHFRDHGWTVRPPRRVQELQSQVIAERERTEDAAGRQPTAAEIAKRLDVPVQDVVEALQAEGCFTPASLDVPLADGSVASVGDQLADADAAHDIDAAEARVVLQPVLRRLGPRDRRIVRMRFYEDRTQQEIADAIGVTQMQVSRLLNRILRDLRGYLGRERGSEDRKVG